MFITNDVDHDRRPENQDRIMRMRDLREFLRLSPSHLYALMAQGKFPKPFALVPGGRSRGWLQSDIVQWVLERKDESAGSII